MRWNGCKLVTRRCTTRIALGVALCVGGLSPLGAGEPVRQPCDCCKLVCIEAEIIKAKTQQDYYEDAAMVKGLQLAEYEAGEQSAAEKGERERVKYADGVEGCNYYDPNLADTMELRRMQMAGFKFGRSDAGSIVGVSYSLKTNLGSCTMSEEAAKYAPKVAPCEGIGAAQVKHEDKHIDDCKERPPGQRALTPAQTAAGEVLGYDAEILKLEELRLVVAAQCMARSCESDKADWDAAADEMLMTIKDILTRGAPKPPSPSPLSTKKGG